MNAAGFIVITALSTIGLTECTVSRINDLTDVGNWKTVKREIENVKQGCEGSVINVEIHRDVTYFKLVTEDNKILFKVGSKDTSLDELTEFLTFVNKVFFSVAGEPKLTGDAIYLMVSSNGSIVKILNEGTNRTLFYKIYPSQQNKLEETRCTFLIGHSVTLEGNVNINHRDSFNMTLPAWVVIFGSREQVKKVIDDGADVDIPGQFGLTPLICTIVSNSCDTLDYILNHRNIDVNKFVNKGTALIHLAAFKKRLECVRVLLDHGADISLKTNILNMTPFHIAIYNEDRNLVQELVKRGANLEEKEFSQRTPLHVAAKDGNTEIIEELLKAGADVNSRNKVNRTPLLEAVDSYNKEERVYNAIKVLLTSNKIDVNAEDIWGKTALSIATSRGFTRVKELLKSHGALDIQRAVV